MTHLEVAETIANTVIPEVGGSVKIACECGGIEAIAYAGERLDWRDVADVIDHALHDHATRYSITLSRSTTMLTGYQIALHSGSPARTEAEEKWRLDQQR